VRDERALLSVANPREHFFSSDDGYHERIPQRGCNIIRQRVDEREIIDRLEPRRLRSPLLD